MVENIKLFKWRLIFRKNLLYKNFVDILVELDFLKSI